MRNFKEILIIAGAFVGVIIGAGFASGQELLIFFVNHGLYGIIGTFISAFLFIFLSMSIASIGNHLKSNSHKDIINYICGNKIGKLVDWIITFFMFGITVVMIAGGGALIEQQLGIPAGLGSLFITLATVFIVCLNLKHVVMLISSVTPLMILVALLISGHSIINHKQDFSLLNEFARTQNTATPYWWLSSILYVSYNIVAGIPILAIMGGATKNNVARWGGLMGGITLSGIMLIMSLGLFSSLIDISGKPMPMIFLAGEISPLISIIASVVIFGMIINTAVGTLYSFVARFTSINNKKFILLSIISGLIAYICSFVGFVNLVATLYPILGYIGFFLIIAIINSWFKYKKSIALSAELT